MSIIFLMISLSLLACKKVTFRLKSLREKFFVLFHFKLWEILISLTSVKTKELFSTISWELMHWKLLLFSKNLFGDLLTCQEMVCSHIHGLSICVMIFLLKIKAVGLLYFSTMEKNTINGKTNTDLKPHMKKN